MRRSNIKKMVFATLIAMPTCAWANEPITSQEQLFLKCYEGMVGDTPQKSSVPYQRILNGESAVKVCGDLVDDMGIDNEGYFKSNNPSRTPDSVVLQIGTGMHRIHDKFIPTPVNANVANAVYLEWVLSYQAGADYMTYVAMKDLPFSTLITSKKAFIALYETRSDGNDSRGRMYQPDEGKLYGLPRNTNGGTRVRTSKTGYVPSPMKEIACPGNSEIMGPPDRNGTNGYPSLEANGGRLRNHGVLKGVFEETYDRTYPTCSTEKDYYRYFTAKPHQSFGAGLGGMSSYMQAHAGFVNGDRKLASDGGMRAGRRWSQRVMEHFFCRKGAVLRIGDTAPFMNIPSTLKGEHVPTFRIASTCMQCHATIDSMAYTIRGNLSANRITGYGGDNDMYMIPEEYSGPLMPSSFNGSSVQQFANALPASDADFFRRPAEGALYFRNFRGNLVYVGPDKVTSLDALGGIIAEQEDFYACAASRYLEQLTSYHITLDDPGANLAELNKNEVYNWFTNTLVKNFYQHRSAKRLIKEIMDSKYFKER